MAKLLCHCPEQSPREGHTMVALSLTVLEMFSQTLKDYPDLQL